MGNGDRERGWVEVSLLLEGELAEPVAAVLADYVEDGVVLERGENPPEDETTRDVVKVYGYLPVDERLEERKGDIQRALWHLGQIQDLPEPSFKPLQVEDWRMAWQENYRPIPLGKRLIVVPAWMDAPDLEREAIFISPGMAFGSGTHPSTKLSLALIDEDLVAREVLPGAMIDIGCGSGILSIAAVKLGVPFVLGLDTDRGAVQVAGGNIHENDVQDRIQIRQGSVRELLQGQFRIHQAPLVCANIIAPVLRTLFGEGLSACVEPGGTLILSGMLVGQVPEILEDMGKAGFKVVSRMQEEDWVALRGVKSVG